MSNNALHAENAAVADLEEVLTSSGWTDGWDFNDADVRAATSPIFYRNGTTAAAEEGKVTAGGQRHTLFLIYKVIEIDPQCAGDRPHHHEITIAINVYHDDPAMLSGAHGSYISDLLDNLIVAGWTVDPDSDETVPSAEDGAPYIFRKTYLIEKVL